VVRLKGVNNRASAEALVSCTVLMPAEDWPELANDDFNMLPLVSLVARLAGNDE
jgi:16S rRNA processing protein RimM